MNLLPQVRNADIVVQDLRRELLVYDLKTHQAYQLNETSMIVYQACADGQTFEDLKRKYKFTDDLIYLSLDTLAKENLIDGKYQSKLAGISRRDAIRRVGLATMIALPLIISLPTPAAAAAASVKVNQCAALSCVDGVGPVPAGGCNPPAGCGALRGDVCCAAPNACTCVPANVCLANGGQICP